MLCPVRTEGASIAGRSGGEGSDRLELRLPNEMPPKRKATARDARSGRFTRLLEVLESAERPPSVQFDFATETRGVDYVAEVRHVDGPFGIPPRDNLE